VWQYLRYVLAAADKRSFRQAPAELGVWESTISRGIRELEDEVGVALFIRHPGGATLTHAGNKFLNHARMAIGRMEYALKDAGGAGRGEVGFVRIGIFSSLASGFLADLRNVIRRRIPSCISDYDQRTSAEDLVPVLQSLSGSASTPHDPLPMEPGEWNGNHNDRAFLMVGVPAYPYCTSNRADP
jgi:DNA-binding transcriptional LysR family regulator